MMRCSPLIEQSELALIIIMVTGAVTAFFAASVGLFQNDIKKVIAYSTMSQLAREYNKFIIFMYQTICEELIINMIINSQITKTCYCKYYNYNSNSFFNLFFAVRQYFLIMSYIAMSVRWKIVIICKLVGISETIRLILIWYKLKLRVRWICYLNLTMVKFTKLFLVKVYFIVNNKVKLYKKMWFKSITKFHSFFEYSTYITSLNEGSDLFNEWLAGVIDGDGYFNLSEKGTARFTVTMDLRDKNALYEIKNKFGGSIYTISNANALRYQLSHKKGLITLINAINGLIRNPTRMLQMNKLCVKYNIKLLHPKPLTFDNWWLSGIIDSDGSVYFNEKSGQVFISITQKNKYMLEPLIYLYGGRIDILSPKIEAFKYVIYRKNELFNLIDNYFIKHPLKTCKASRIHLIKQFYSLRIYKNGKEVNKYNEWILFKDKWKKYKD